MNRGEKTASISAQRVSAMSRGFCMARRRPVSLLSRAISLSWATARASLSLSLPEVRPMSTPTTRKTPREIQSLGSSTLKVL